MNIKVKTTQFPDNSLHDYSGTVKVEGQKWTLFVRKDGTPCIAESEADAAAMIAGPGGVEAAS